MPNPAVRGAFARGPLAATDKAGRPGAFRHAEAPASLVEERVAAEASVVDRSFVLLTCPPQIVPRYVNAFQSNGSQNVRYPALGGISLCRPRILRNETSSFFQNGIVGTLTR